MARTPKNPTISLPSSVAKAPVSLPSNEPSPSVTFSPAALQALIAECTEQRKMIADLLQLKAATGAAPKPAKAAKGKASAPTMSIAGKTDKAIANELLAIKLFKKQGFSNVIPHVNIKTYNRWMAENRRPIEGSKSIRVNNLRLFHITQTREVTSAEKIAY